MQASLTATVVGADQLGNIPKVLSEFGIGIGRHITGRDPSHQRRTVSLPSGTDLLILFTDFLGHNVMKNFRDAAQRDGVRMVCCKRSVCSVKQTLEGCGYACASTAACAAECAGSDGAGRANPSEQRLRFMAPRRGK